MTQTRMSKSNQRTYQRNTQCSHSICFQNHPFPLKSLLLHHAVCVYLCVCVLTSFPGLSPHVAFHTYNHNIISMVQQATKTEDELIDVGSGSQLHHENTLSRVSDVPQFRYLMQVQEDTP